MTYNCFANNMIALRARKGLSQAKMANELIIGRGTFAAWEEGRGTPNYNKLIDVARYFEVTIDQLLTEKLTF